MKKPKQPKKYKTTIKVLDDAVLMGYCECGWIGNRLSQKGEGGLGAAMTAVQGEIQSHKHIPKEKK